jgi:four helix bundle protein
MVYQLTRKWPKEEMFGLTRQVREAASSVPSNIAEGFGRFNSREFHQFCNVGQGSLFESQSELVLARDLGYNTHEEWLTVNAQAILVRKLLRAFMRTLRTS